MPPDVTISAVAPHAVAPLLPGLAELLLACVEQGASVGFVLPATVPRMLAYWQKMLPQFQAGARQLLVATLDQQLVGTVHLVLDMPENGKHRADINKLLVHPRARRQGIARALMAAAERAAWANGRRLLVLDTVPGSGADRLYADMGYQCAGTIPDYVVDTHNVALVATALYYKTFCSAPHGP
jgi:GNAT superfamily N-acetyltransferase